MPQKISQRFLLAARVLRSGALPTRHRTEVPALTAEDLAEIQLFFPLEKFFIFGHARSGTTLLARLARLHPQVHCNWQAHFFTRPPLLEALVADPQVAAWLKRGSNRWNRGGDLSAVVLRVTADYMLEREARQLGKTIVGDKSPNSLLDGEAVRLAHKIFPDARLIYILRDGRDTVLSHRFQSFIDTPEQLSAEDLRIRAAFIADPQPFLHGERSVFTAQGISKAARGWVRNVQETQTRGQELYGQHFLTLRYEDLLCDLWDQMVQVWDFLGASPPDAGLQPDLQAELNRNLDADWQREKAGEIAGELQKGKQGSWRELFTPRDQQVFQEIAAEVLKASGYEG